MPKIEINQVAEILKRNKADPALLRSVVEEMNLHARDKAKGENDPAPKKQFVILVSDPDNRLPDEDFVGWCVQIPDMDSPVTTLDRVLRGAYEFNATKKGRLLPVQRIGEALEHVPARIFKESEVWVKTKTPVLIVRTNNLIPRDKSNAHEDTDEESSGR